MKQFTHNLTPKRQTDVERRSLKKNLRRKKQQKGMNFFMFFSDKWKRKLKTLLPHKRSYPTLTGLFSPLRPDDISSRPKTEEEE